MVLVYISLIISEEEHLFKHLVGIYRFLIALWQKKTAKEEIVD
jgi:hypothetical protein